MHLIVSRCIGIITPFEPRNGNWDLDDNSFFKVEAVEVLLCPLTEMELLQLRQRFNVDLVTITIL
jgi:hypothetical protein